MSRATSNKRLRPSNSPPPPRRPPPAEEDELELELDEELLPEPGVGPEVTGAAQGVLPALAGAWLLAPPAVTVTSALSLRP